MIKGKRVLATVVVVLIVLLVARTVLDISRKESEILPVSVDVTQPFYVVYFGCPDAASLVPEFFQGEGTVEERVASLLAGPKQSHLSAVVPEGVEFLGYSQRGDVLYLNFSYHLLTNHPGGSAGELLTVYAIVNSLVGVQGVRRVQILVEGRSISTLAGHLDLREPLEKDFGILESSHM